MKQGWMQFCATLNTKCQTQIPSSAIFSLRESFERDVDVVQTEYY
jgi:hypothetical protein